MKLLLDENLSPRLVHLLSDRYPGSRHVHDCGLGAADDSVVWKFAMSHDFAIVSKDSDFYQRSVLYGSPPKAVWIRAGNCTTSQIEALVRQFAVVLEAFSTREGESCLALTRRGAKTM